MKQLRLLALGMGTVFFAGSVVLVACSSDDTVVPTTTEAGVPDTGVPETGPTDGGTDGNTDIDAGFTIENMQTNIANAICDALSRCCYGAVSGEDAGVDGGHFDRNACVQFSKGGFATSNIGLDKADAGAILLNQAKAKECVDRLNALACSPTPTDYALARQACFDAVYGKGIAGSACTQTIECGQGLFCDTADGGADGGMGSCQNVRAVDGQCGDFTSDPALADQACSSRGSGDTNRFCRTYTNDFTQLDPADWKCAQSGAVGDVCAQNTWCSASFCENENTFKCQAADVPVFSTATCGAFVK